MELEKLKQDLKALIVAECFPEDDAIDPAEITDDVPLFGSQGVGLDSLDALQLSVALKRRYGVRIEGAKDGQKYLASIDALAAFIQSHNA